MGNQAGVRYNSRMIETPRRSLAASGRVKVAVLLVPLALVLLSFALRVWRLGSQPLRGDEAFTMVMWLRSLRETFTTLAVTDPQPPVAVLSIYYWVKLVGSSEFAARYLSVLAGALTTAALYGLGRTLVNRRAGLLAALFSSLSAWLIWFAQDLRPTALWVALSALATWAMLQAVRRPRRFGMWAVYVISMALSLYTFYLELFTLAVHNLYVLTRVWRNRGLFWRWVASQLAIGAILAPWFLQPRLYSSGYAPTAGPVRLLWAFQAFLFGETLPAPFNGMTESSHIVGLAAVLALVLALVALAAMWWQAVKPFRNPHPPSPSPPSGEGGKGKRTKLAQAEGVRTDSVLFITLYAFLPLVLLAAFTLVTGSGYFRPRYIAAAAPGWLLLVAAGALSLANLAGPRAVWRSAAAALCVVMVGVNLAGLWAYHFDPAFAKAPTWRDLADVLAAQARPDDALVYNYPDPAVAYYLGQYDPFLLPQDGFDTADTLLDLANHHRAIWFISVPSPAWDPDQTVLGWLNDNLELVSDQYAGSLRLMQFAPYLTGSVNSEQLLTITYGQLVTLVGYATTPPDPSTLHPGDTLSIQLFWSPISPTQTPMTVFVHLLGPARADGGIQWAGDDHLPQNGHTSTVTWQVRPFLRDVYTITLPADAPPGQYMVTAGWYDAATGERITALNGPDVVPLGPGEAQLFTFTLEGH